MRRGAGVRLPVRSGRGSADMEGSVDKQLPQVLAQAENLPSLTPVALEVLRRCREEETTLDDLAEVLARDPPLSARLLRFANSSLYDLGDDVRTLQRAALLLGMKAVQLMSLSISLVSSLPREGQAGGFDYGRFWRRALVRAVIARALAARVGSPAQDEAFLCGLWGEIGQVVLVRCLPAEYGPVLRAASAGQTWPDVERERAALGFDHSAVGEALLRSWQLPGPIALAVGHMLRPDELPPETPQPVVELVRLLALACEASDLLTGEAPGALQRSQELARRYFQLTAEELQELLLSLEAPAREVAEILDLPPPAEKVFRKILGEARTPR